METAGCLRRQVLRPLTRSQPPRFHARGTGNAVHERHNSVRNEDTGRRPVSPVQCIHAVSLTLFLLHPWRSPPKHD